MMLVEMFERVLRLTVYGTVAGVGVWLISLLADRIRAPKWISLVLWGLVGLSLLTPVETVSGVSLYQIGDLDQRIENTLSFDRLYADYIQRQRMGTAEPSEAAGEEIPVMRYYGQSASGQAPERALWELAILGGAVLWAGGVLILWLWGIASYIGLKRKLRFAIKCEDAVYETDEISSPCVAGILKAKIYLTPGLLGKQREYIILHEKMHIRHLDHIWKVISFMTISLHWFNPCLWYFWSYFQGELERACDERVLRRIGIGHKEDYSQSLLALAHAKERGWNISVPVAFGENDTKGRIRRILKYRKPLAAASAVAAALGLCAFGVLFTVPEKKDGEEVYEEISDEDDTYQARQNGIYRVGEEREVQIYKGFAGSAPRMSIFEGRLYFLTDRLYEEGNLDWMDNTVRWIDLKTFETGELVLGRKNPLIANYRIHDGFLMVDYMAPEGVEGAMLYHEGERVWNGKGIAELSEEEILQFGENITEFVLHNKGTLVNVSNRIPGQNITYLDMDGNGSMEKIVLEPTGQEHEEDWILKYYFLRIGEAILEGFGYNLANTLWAWSPDGERIYLITYEDGPSADPCSHFYCYRDGNIMEAGGIDADIRNCIFYPDGTVQGGILKEIVQTDWIEVRWRIRENGMLEEIPQETYAFLSQNEIELLEELPVHTGIGEEETFAVKPQTVRVLETSADFGWILIETKNGEQGWVHIVNFEVPELGKNVMDVFKGRYMAG